MNGGIDLIRSGILNEEVLGEDAADGVVWVVAAVALGSGVTNLAWSKSARLESNLGVAANGGDLLGKLKDDVLVESSSVVRSRVLSGNQLHGSKAVRTSMLT